MLKNAKKNTQQCFNYNSELMSKSKKRLIEMRVYQTQNNALHKKTHTPKLTGKWLCANS
jgi:hypothetical protein